MAELIVTKKSVEEILSLTGAGMKGKTYVIPNYQRPYKWERDQCETLWNDLTNFYEEKKLNPDSEHEYFLGSIVTCTDEADPKRKIDVIDGQQRLTTLFLMLRAFYTKLETLRNANPTDDEIAGLMRTLEPCIWKVNEMTMKVTDRTDIHIHSLVATDKDNDTFDHIIATGEIPISNQSNYAKNYAFFLDKYIEYINKHIMDWKMLCLTVIKKCIMLPIECNDLESALTIFGTLNNRGLPLADSDIFKAELYKRQPSQADKQNFANEWKDLDETASNGGLKIDDIFRYYTHIIRGYNDNKSKEIGLRNFYKGEGGKFKAFDEPDFFSNLKDLADFWEDLNITNDRFKESRSNYCNTEAKKWLQCLNCFTNDYWKYPTSVYFHHHKAKFSKEHFANFLKRMMANLFVRFIESPTVNAIKDPVFAACIEIAKTGDANFSYPIPENFSDTLNRVSTWRIARTLILLNSYLFNPEQRLIPESFQIEHILPQKWQNTNYNGWTIEDAKTHLEMFGNKVAFEWKLNIWAGNGYFGKKKLYYDQSSILEAKELAFHDGNDWTKEDIDKRNTEVLDRIETFFRTTINN